MQTSNSLALQASAVLTELLLFAHSASEWGVRTLHNSVLLTASNNRLRSFPSGVGFKHYLYSSCMCFLSFWVDCVFVESGDCV